VGRQDLTAHVDFTALERAAADLGLEVLGTTTQDRFLIGNGILDVFEERDADRWRSPAGVKARLQAMQLIHPSAMGRSFRVLALAKGCAETPRLSGLVDPFGGRSGP
jgi:SAM-dependent MidA family methyltransferase